MTMGVRTRVRANLRSLRDALGRLRQRGFGWGEALALQLPAAVALRAARRLASPINGRLLGAWVNAPRFARFQAALPATERLRLYVIVMPDVLHFLLPCLALLRGRVPLVLVANAARAWELELLRQYLPEAPLFALQHLPGTSVDHGDVISLLIEHHRGPFGIVDHDCYLFDERLLDQLPPAADECLVTLFAEPHPHLPFELPLTHLLALNAEPLRALMHEFGIDARLKRSTPKSARLAFLRLGLPQGAFFKPYQRFHDTLHLLLGLALDRGFRVRVPRSQADLPFVHIGGTSIGSHHSKNLFALYVHLRFLELLGDDTLRQRYAFMTRPLVTAADALARRRADDRGWDGLPLLEQALPLLREALHRAWPTRHPLTEASSR